MFRSKEKYGIKFKGRSQESRTRGGQRPRVVQAQGSLEYLLLYGFGIVIIIAILVLSWQLGVFSEVQDREKGSGGFSQLVVEDFIAKRNFLNLSIKNNAPDIARIIGINVSIEYKINCSFSDIIEISPGGKSTIQLNCPPEFGETYPSGKYYKAYVEINYINVRTNNLHSSLGYIWGVAE